MGRLQWVYHQDPDLDLSCRKVPFSVLLRMLFLQLLQWEAVILLLILWCSLNACINRKRNEYGGPTAPDQFPTQQQW